MDRLKTIEAHAFGNFGENVVANEYIKQGYVILERKWRLGKIEIDLIAQKDNIIVLVEVKSRSGNWNDPFEEIDRAKKLRMIRAADAYLCRMKGDYDYRFDFVGVVGNIDNYKIEILEDAFLATDVF